MKQTYIRCPRCELNYILKKDKLCNVCKAEMKALGNMGTDEDMDLDLCPICKTNYINADEDICPACAKEREDEEEDGLSSAPTSVWDTYTTPDDDEGYNDDEDSDMVSITGLDDGPLDDTLDLGLDDEDEEQEESEEISNEMDELEEDFSDIDTDGDDDDEDDDDDDDDF